MTALGSASAFYSSLRQVYSASFVRHLQHLPDLLDRRAQLVREGHRGSVGVQTVQAGS
ncbi:hypothetical protein [Streptomyces sp. NPDC017890]|uniref:hypothetical protein n=1 Tax=Streptomyces sp. NPDC017890 TaxID=3365015 RepID=UPI0037ABDB41